MGGIMNAAEHPSDGTASPVENFIKGFFGLGNAAWPGQDPGSSAGRGLRPQVDIVWAREATEVPIVLPRRRESDGGVTVYVIARDRARAVVIADLITAFVGPTYSSFDGLPAQLDPADSVDRAVLEFVGDGLTFKVASPRMTEGAAWKALLLLQDTVRQRPVRTWHVRKPVGRLLGEFEAALAAGDNFASGELLEQITAAGGLSPANLTNLKIKRLARLGRDAELLRLPGLADVVLTHPPTPIKDAILAAIYSTTIAAALETGDLKLAAQTLQDASTFVLPLLGDGTAGLLGLSGEALAVVGLTANIRDDKHLLAAVMLDPHRRMQLAHVSTLLADALGAVATANAAPFSSGALESPVEAELAAPGSWLELVRVLSTGNTDVASVLASHNWEEWNPPDVEDEAIADILTDLGNEAADRAWLLAGPLVDADGYRRPAARTARQLIEIALLNDRFSPGDLAGIVALVEIFLRSGPNAGAYAALLDDLEGESNRWAGPDRATVVLDLVDLLVRAACPDQDARLRLALALLRPLRGQYARLEPEQARFARQLSAELQVGLEWPARDDTSQESSLPQFPAVKVLLYSLDERVLERTKSILNEMAPNADIRLSHDKVGSVSLKQYAHGAEVIVMATRCAKHAATGFIRQHAPGTSVIAEADGSGSASLLRAVVAAIRMRTGQ
jgi:hypothetical protein